jgi:hypothetical protein
MGTRRRRSALHEWSRRVCAVIVTAGFADGYGAGTHVERVLRTLGPVEYVVLTVAVVAAGTFFLWRAIRA